MREEGQSAGTGMEQVSVSVAAGDVKVVVPDGGFMFSADFSRQGSDLLIEGEAGRSVLVEGYFDAAMRPTLLTPAGAQMTPDIVEALLVSVPSQVQLAQAATAVDGSPIGQVEQVQGLVQALRTNGDTDRLNQGDPVFQGDVIQTAANSTVGISFVDGTLFSLSPNARMTLDEMVYNAGGADNSMTMSILTGTFVFITGQVAPTGNMTVNTPVAAIGIRGTTTSGEILSADGTTRYVLRPDPDTSVGVVSLTNPGGVTILDEAFESVTLTSFTAPHPPTTILPPQVLLADPAYLLTLQILNESYERLQRRDAGEDEEDSEEDGDGEGEEDSGALSPEVEEAIEAAESLEPAAGPIASGIGPVQTLQVGLQQLAELAIPTPQQVGNPEPPTPPPDNDDDEDDEQIPNDGGPADQDDILIGDGGDNVFDGGVGNDTLRGGAGNDTLRGGAGDDIIDGGAGVDFADYSGGDGVVVDLGIQGQGNSQDTVSAGTDTLIDIEGLLGSDNDDTLIGDGGDNEFDGGAGNDTLRGFDGNDTLRGGAGDDIIDGGPGDDTLIGGTGNDQVTGGAGIDTVVLDGPFSEIQFELGSVRAINTATGSTVTVNDDVEIYQDSTGATSRRPDAADDSFDTDAVTIVNGNVLADNGNGADSDPDSDPLTVSLDSEPTDGSLNLIADGSFAYNPNGAFDSLTAGQIATDSFTYVVRDNKGTSGEGLPRKATVTITINGVNDAPALDLDADDSAAGGSDFQTTFVSGAGAVAVTDVDVQILDVDDTEIEGATVTLINAQAGDILSIVGTLPAGIMVDGANSSDTTLALVGTAALADYEAALETVRFDNGLQVPDTTDRVIEFLVNDGEADSNVATTTVLVGIDNLPPVAEDDAFTVNEDTLLNGNVLEDNGNGADSDPNGDPLTVSLETGPADGTLDLDADGSFTYTPDADFNGQDSFFYILSDGQEASSATVTITIDPVNDAPSFVLGANPEVDEDAGPQTLPGFATAILPGGGVDEAGQVLSFNITTDNDGLFAVGPAIDPLTGNLTYTPAENAFGTATVTVSFSDDGGTANGGQDTSAEQTFDIVINPINDAPELTTSAGATVGEGATITIGAASLLTTDPDNAADELVYTVGEPPSDGTLFRGVVALGSNDTFTQADIDAGQVSYQHGGNAPDTIDAFSFTVTDGTDTLPEAVFEITVDQVDDPPVIEINAGLTVDEGAVGQILDTLLLVVDIDTPADQITIELVSGPVNGELQLAGSPVFAGDSFVMQDIIDGVISYEHDGGETTADSFVFRVSDGTTTLQDATFEITVDPVNDDPVAVDDDVFGVEDTQLGGNVLADNGNGLDSDPEGDALTVDPLQDQATAQGGVVTLNAGGDFVYTPAADFFGTDSFTYTLRDENSGTDTATVTIVVDPVNDAPEVTTNLGLTLDEGATAGIGSTLLEATDPDNQASQLTYTVSSPTQVGQLLLDGQVVGQGGTFTQAQVDQGLLSYVHDGSETTDDSFTFDLSDGDQGTSSQTFTISVVPVNDLPIIADGQAFQIAENSVVGAAVGDVEFDDPDVGDSFTFQITGGNTGNAFAIDNSGQITVATPGALDFETTPRFDLTVLITDQAGAGATDTTIVTIDLTDVNEAPADIALSNDTIPENIGVGSLVGFLTSIDPDIGDTASFEIVDDPDQKFQIAGAANDQLQLSAPVDFEDDTSHDVTIRVTDGGGLTFDRTFTINVTDVVEGPIDWTNTSGDRLWENPSNWEAGVVPGDGEDVFIQGGLGDPIFSANSPATTLNSLSVSGAILTVTGGTLGLSGSGSFSNGSTLRIEGGEFIADGPTSFDADSALRLFDGTYSGSGETRIQGVFNWTAGTIAGTGDFIFEGTAASIGGAGIHTLDGRTLTISGPLNISNATLGGTGNVVNLNDLTVIQGDLDTALSNQGSVLVQGPSSFDGVFENLDGATLRLEGIFSGATSLSVASGFVNDGTIELVSGAGFGTFFRIESGILLNQGTIRSFSISGSDGVHNINSTVENAGRIEVVDRSLTIVNAGTTFTNSGEIHIDGIQTLAISGDNTSVINLLDGTTLTGTGIFFLIGTQTLNLGIDLVLNDATPILELNGSATVNGIAGAGSITVESTGFLSLIGDRINVALTNQGTLRLATATLSEGLSNEAGANLIAFSGGNSITSSSGPAFTNAAQATLVIEADANGTQFFVAAGFTNEGTILLTNTAADPQSAILTVGGNTLVNELGGIIQTTQSVAGTVDFTISGAFDNRGTLDVDHNLTIETGGRTVVNSGTIDIAADQSLTVIAASFDNLAGAVIQGFGTLDVTGTTFVNAGTLAPGTSPGSFIINGDFTQTADGVLLIELAGDPQSGQFDVLTVQNGNATLGGTLRIDLTDGFVPTPGQSFDILIDGEGDGLLGQFDAVEVVDDLTALGLTVEVDDDLSDGTLTLTFADAATNVNWTNGAGSEAWEDGGNWEGGQVPDANDVASVVGGVPGPIVSANSGTQEVGTLSVSQGGAVTVQGGVLNVQNSASFDSDSSLLLSGGTYGGSGDTTIQGAFNWTGGTLTGTGEFTINGFLSVTGDGSQTLDGRTLTIGADGGGSIERAAIVGTGTISNSGSILLRGVTIDVDLVNGGLLRAEGATATINGGFSNAAGGVFQLEGDPVQGRTQVVLANGLANFGEIVLTNDESGDRTVTLEIAAGTLVNEGTIRAEAGTGSGNATRQIIGEVENRGTIQVVDIDLAIQTTTLLNNSGIIDIAAGETLTVSGSAFNNVTGGVIQGFGTLDVTGTTFVNAGTLAPGTSAGSFTISGDYTQTTDGVLLVELAGNPASQNFDVLTIQNGDAILGGTLRIDLIDGFAPTVGQSFDILIDGEGDGLLGQFDNFEVVDDLAALGLAARFDDDVSDGVFTLSFVALNTAPVVDLNGDDGAVFTEDAAAVPVDVDLVVVDQDVGETITGAVVQIQDLQSVDDELLAVDTTGTNITGSYDEATGVLTLSGDDSLANYQQVLQSLTYRNNSQAPAGTSRSISYQLTDAAGLSSAAVVATVMLIALNDAPVLAAPGLQTVADPADLIFSTQNGNAISVADVDAGSGEIQASLSVQNGVLTLADTSGLTTVVGDGTANVTIGGAQDAVNAAFDGLAYNATDGFTGRDDLTVAVDDLGNSGAPGALTDVETVGIQVNDDVVLDATLTIVGDTSFGTFSLTTGETFTTQQFIIGNEATGFGTVLIDGAGAKLTVTGGASQIIVGNAGVGILTVQDQGEVDPETLVIGAQTGSAGFVAVDNATLLLTDEAATPEQPQLIVGDRGQGTLDIVNGGRVVNEPEGVTFIGRESGSVGNVLLAGTADDVSSLEAGRLLLVGQGFDPLTGEPAGPSTGGAGALFVDPNSVVSAGRIEIGTGAVILLSGTLQGDVTMVGGVLDIGPSIVTAQILGDFDLLGGQLRFEFDDAVPQEADLLLVQGDVELSGGKVTIDLVNILEPILALDEATLIEANSFAFDPSNVSLEVIGVTQDLFFSDIEIGVSLGGDAFGIRALADIETGNSIVFFGSNTDDLLSSGPGDDLLDGGEGTDLLSYAASPVGVTVDLNIFLAQNTGHGNDILTSIENLVGSEQSDLLNGDGRDNLLAGLDGDDRITGAGGSDTLIGGLGRDILAGGAGTDRFFYESPEDGGKVTTNISVTDANNGGVFGDSLADFDANGDDLLEISGANFGIDLQVGIAEGTNFGTTTEEYDGTNATGSSAAYDAGEAAFIRDGAGNLIYDDNGAEEGYTIAAQDTEDRVDADDFQVVA